MKTVRVIAAKEFSSTIFGNVSKGDVLNVRPARRVEWLKQGLIVDEEVDLNAMSVDELEAFALQRFGVDIDKRKKVATLRKEVKELLEVV